MFVNIKVQLGIDLIIIWQNYFFFMKRSHNCVSITQMVNILFVCLFVFCCFFFLGGGGGGRIIYVDLPFDNKFDKNTLSTL